VPLSRSSAATSAPLIVAGLPLQASAAGEAPGSWSSTAPMSEPSAPAAVELETPGKATGLVSPRWSLLSPKALPLLITGLVVARR